VISLPGQAFRLSMRNFELKAMVRGLPVQVASRAVSCPPISLASEVSLIFDSPVSILMMLAPSRAKTEASLAAFSNS